MPRPPPDRRRGRQTAQRASPATPRNPARSAVSGRAKVSGTFEARRRADGGHPGGSGDPAARSKVSGTFEGRPERPLREDLVIQAALEAYGAVRHEGRLADRALDHASGRSATSTRTSAAPSPSASMRCSGASEPSTPSSTAPAHASSSAPPPSRTCSASPPRACCTASVRSTSPGPPASARRKPGSSRRCPAPPPSSATLPRAERFALDASLPDFLAARLLRQFGDAPTPRQRR